MRICGVICEYNPFHRGHEKQLRQIRAALGEDTAVVCLMSGNFVQRGEPAVFDKRVRAQAAVLAGANLVLELPITKALSSAEESCDVVLSRNLTWTLPEPEKAYREWFRVLKPGGWLLNFDADYAANVRSHSMQNCKVAPDSPYGHIGMTDALQQENDEITLTMDIGQLRPAWDMRVLRRIGFSDCRSDATVGQRILGALDLTHAPMFGIWARKA